MANPFEKFAAATKSIANEWDPSRTPDIRMSGPHAPYESAGSGVINQASEIDAAFGKLPIALGIFVQFRFIHIAARTARQNGVSFDKFSDAIRHPDSFAQNLGVVASSPIGIATGLELSMGVRHPHGYTDPEVLPYSVGETVTIPDLDLRLRELRSNPDNSSTGKLGRCPSRLVLPSVYQDMVSIALSDPAIIRHTIDGLDVPPAKAKYNFTVVSSSQDSSV